LLCAKTERVFMNKEVKEVLRVRYKMLILELAGKHGNIAKTCRDFDITKSSFYKWKKAFDLGGKEGLKRKKPIAYNHPKKISKEAIDRIL
jgi:transposase-like protein